MSRTRIGKYQLVERLARGGMGEVFVAQRDDSATLCVVKLLHEGLADHQDSVQRFKREAHLASMLRHPRIAPVLDAGFEDGVFYLATELIVGRDLGRLVHALRAKGHTVTVPVAVTLVAEVLDALDHAHAARDAAGEPMRVVHRDLKPSNVVVGIDGHASVIDFGVASASIDSWRTSPGRIMGTMRYFSPEQARGQVVDGRTDVYAVSAILFELLAGRPLVEGKLDGEVSENLARVFGAELPSSCALNPAVSPALESVIARGLARDPAHRWATAGLLRAELLELVGTVDAKAIGELVRVHGGPVLARLEQLRAEAVPSMARHSTPTRTELELPTAIDDELPVPLPSVSAELVVPTDLTTPGYVPPHARLEAPLLATTAVHLPSRPPPPEPGSLETPVPWSAPVMVAPPVRWAVKRVRWALGTLVALGVGVALVVGRAGERAPAARPRAGGPAPSAASRAPAAVGSGAEPTVSMAPTIGVVPVGAEASAREDAATPPPGAVDRSPTEPTAVGDRARVEGSGRSEASGRSEGAPRPARPEAGRRAAASPSATPLPRPGAPVDALRRDIQRLIADWDALTPEARGHHFVTYREALFARAASEDTKKTLARMLRDDALRGDEQDARRLLDGLVLIEHAAIP